MAKNIKTPASIPSLKEYPKHYIKDEQGIIIPIQFRPVTLELIDNVEKLFKQDNRQQLQTLQSLTIAKLMPYIDKNEADSERQITKAALIALEKGELTSDDINKLNELKAEAPKNRTMTAKQNMEIFKICVMPTDPIITDDERLRKVELRHVERCVQDFLSYSGMN